MLAASIAAILVIPLCIISSYEGTSRILCLNWNENCDPNQFLAIGERGMNLRDILPPPNTVAPIAAVVITIVFAITCCSTCLCHQCCRKRYKSNCLPMTDIKEYDTDVIACSDTL